MYNVFNNGNERCLHTKLLRKTDTDVRETRPFYRRNNDHVGKSLTALLPSTIISALGLGTWLVYQVKMCRFQRILTKHRSNIIEIKLDTRLDPRYEYIPNVCMHTTSTLTVGGIYSRLNNGNVVNSVNWQLSARATFHSQQKIENCNISDMIFKI